jgi:hypothetical protein
MGDLPGEEKFFEVVKNTKIFHSREKCEDFSNW